jgi:pSer/pThr/pTyr-binding forkhead associated (FHA) protein/uncharacterized protein YraI
MSQSQPPAFEADFLQPEPQLQIVVHAGPLAGKGFPISGNVVTFGRDPENDISWDDSQVSRRHARIMRRGSELILVDLGSTNGTLVNGKPIAGEHVLQPADIISIGSSIFGVKGFAAPSTVGVTQVSPMRSVSPRGLPSTPPPAYPATRPPSTFAPAAGRLDQKSSFSMLAIMGIGLLILAILALALITGYFLVRGSGSPVAQVPSVVITAPANGSQVQLNQPVTVQATASDPSGVTRMELWVDGVKIAEATSPAAQGQPTFTASLQWTPAIPGSHTLEIKAYNVQQRVNEPTTILVNVAGNSAPTDTPTPTPSPQPPTATALTIPHLTTLTDLNVRNGPGTDYEFVGLLLSGKTAEIIGRDENRQWWQIRFEPAPGGVGWVIADPVYSTALNTDTIPVTQGPPTPTGAPADTPTFTPTPTGTPTATPVPATETPLPTNTPSPTPAGSSIKFEVSPASIQGGECVNVNWSVVQVKEVYYQGEGVPGVGGKQECPHETTIYRLRVVHLDNTEEVVDRTVEVINPVSSAGTITIDPNQTIDFDDGVIPGDDFRWKVEGGIRLFEISNGVQLAPMEQLVSLSQLSRDACLNAKYDTYTFIDGSDVITDPNNALTAGRTACYRTNQGRLGKLRFPAYSTQSLTIEWLTWK